MTKKKPINWVTLLRKTSLGLTQPLLAGILGVASLTISRWERGETEPSGREKEILQSLEALANHPDIDQDRLHNFLANPMEAIPTEDLVWALRLSSLEKASARIIDARLGTQGLDVVAVMGAKRIGNFFRKATLKQGE